jgi:hypothetical protein
MYSGRQRTKIDSVYGDAYCAARNTSCQPDGNRKIVGVPALEVFCEIFLRGLATLADGLYNQQRLFCWFFLWKV